MTSIWMVVALALLPGVGDFLGTVAAEFHKPSPRFLNWALHSAAGSSSPSWLSS